jgi:hypothetical protein
MKYALITIFLSIIGFAQSNTPPTGVPSSSQSILTDQQNQNKAKVLLDQMIQSLGGNAYLTIEDVSQEGRTYSFHLGNPTSAGLIFWRFYKYPDKERIELTKQRDIVEVFNGQVGVEITFKGAQPMDAKALEDFLRRREYALDVVLRKWLKEPGIALFYDGPSVANQKSAEKVTIMNTRNQAVDLYIDANTYLPLKKSFSWRDPTDKQRNIEEEVYDNYRPVGAIMSPFVVTRYFNGDMSNQRFITSTSYNKGLTDSMFSTQQGAPRR